MVFRIDGAGSAVGDAASDHGFAEALKNAAQRDKDRPEADVQPQDPGRPDLSLGNEEPADERIVPAPGPDEDGVVGPGDDWQPNPGDVVTLPPGGFTPV